MAIEVAEAEVPLAEVTRPKVPADVIRSVQTKPDAHECEKVIFDRDLPPDDGQGNAARGIILAASISAPIWALIAFTVHALR
jgi:hypothetical protein